MPARPILYYITDRTAFPGTESERRLHLLLKIAEATRAGVDYIQLREKDLPTRELEMLAHDAVQVVGENSRSASPTRLLINSRTDIALAVAAHGVHLPAGDVSPATVRHIVQLARNGGSYPADAATRFTTAVSCHTTEEVHRAAKDAATFAVFAPVFEKKDSPTTRAAGLIALREACRAAIPILALGGVTLTNARSCLDAGAAGVAAIRLFQENDVTRLVHQLCSL
jgi:thiamine-phosphate pyrophosphorylase